MIFKWLFILFVRNIDLSLIQMSFDKMLRAIDTDYTDFGYIFGRFVL